MSEPNQNQHQRPAISDYHSATDHHPERQANASLWLRHKREGGAPFLEGYVMVGESQKVQVYGHLTALDKNAEAHGEGHPVLRLSAQNPDEADALGKCAAWPQNSRKDGKPVNYRTLVLHVGGGKTVYPTVFDGIGEDRKHLGFADAPRQTQTAHTEATPSADADVGSSPAP